MKVYNNFNFVNRTYLTWIRKSTNRMGKKMPKLFHMFEKLEVIKYTWS